jgi:hypothetical protein
MTRDQWNKLDTPAQTIWDSLPDEAKAIILDRKSSNRTPHRPRHAANLHKISARDLLSSLSTGSTTETDITSTDTNANDDNKDTNQQDNKHPGNITRMMSTSNAKKPPSSVVIDGHTYSIKMHRITDTTNTNGKITY